VSAALQEALCREFERAALRLRLDEELGTRHGLAWDEFVLLEAVEEAGGALATRSLAGRLGLRPSALVLRLLPLEKTGWLERATSCEGARSVRLRAPGRRLLAEARETAGVVCAL
jgi:DNA-binding MarR family transcriptional regulator